MEILFRALSCVGKLEEMCLIHLHMQNTSIFAQQDHQSLAVYTVVTQQPVLLLQCTKLSFHDHSQVPHTFNEIPFHLLPNILLHGIAPCPPFPQVFANVIKLTCTGVVTFLNWSTDEKGKTGVCVCVFLHRSGRNIGVDIPVVVQGSYGLKLLSRQTSEWNITTNKFVLLQFHMQVWSLKSVQNNQSCMQLSCLYDKSIVSICYQWCN